MQARHLLTNLRVYITDGPFTGFTATVVDPTVQPDGSEYQRKVLVSIDGAGPNGDPFDTYILPRQLDVAPPAPSVVPSAALPQEEAALTVISKGEVQRGAPITDPMDPALDEFRPDPKVVKEYVSRLVPGGLKDVDYLLHLRDMRDSNGYSPNVALVGETQSGKTMLVEVLACLAAERDGLPKPYPVFTLNGSVGISSYDLFGQPGAVVIDGKETIVWMDGLVPLALNCGGFLYLDEWNAVAPQQATALHPVLDARRSFTNYQRAVPDGHGGYRPEVVKANPGLWVISTINPGYKGTQSMAEASTNRFRWMEWDYDASTEEAIIPSTTVRALGAALREARAQRAITVPVGTSALRRLNEDLASFGVENALWVFSSMFPPSERDRVRAICDDRGFTDLLRAEYPTPVFAPQPAVQPVSPATDPF